MQINPYLSFRGDCEAAFHFYEQCLGGELGPIFHYGGTPMASDVPADWSGKVVHGSLKLGGVVLMGGDVALIVTRHREASRCQSRSRARRTPTASFRNWPGTARWSCRWRKHSGPSVSACSSIASAYPG